MEKLTVIIPTYNEELHIKEAIESVLFADEILIVDSHSTDNTLKIAEKFSVKIIQREYNYSASQKNWAIPQAKHDWIFILDADERITKELKHEVIEILKSPPQEIIGYWIYRNNHFIDRSIRFSGWQNDKVIRLFKKECCRYEDKMVHSEIQTTGKIGFLKQKIIHYSFSSVKQYVQKLNNYAIWQAKDYDLKTGKLNLFHFFIKPLWRFTKHYFVQQGFRDGIPGLTISFLQAYAVLMRYVNLWIIRNHDKS